MKNRIPDLEQRIIYENNELLIVDKPFDIPSTGRTLEDDDSVQFWLQQRHGGMIWAVHQLDADTTGLNIFVKQRHLVQLYKGYLSQADSVKSYLTIVHGKPEWQEWDEYSKIGYIDQQSLGVCEHGKTAHSHFVVIDHTAEFSLVKVRIFTGRTHQIRIHLSHLGHPVVGEEWYCKPPCKLHRRQALHAWKLLLNSTPPQKFIAPPLTDFKELAARLGLKLPTTPAPKK